MYRLIFSKTPKHPYLNKELGLVERTDKLVLV